MFKDAASLNVFVGLCGTVKGEEAEQPSRLMNCNHFRDKKTVKLNTKTDG